MADTIEQNIASLVKGYADTKIVAAEYRCIERNHARYSPAFSSSTWPQVSGGIYFASNVGTAQAAYLEPPME
jgi:hypothetical protein